MNLSKRIGMASQVYDQRQRIFRCQALRSISGHSWRTMQAGYSEIEEVRKTSPEEESFTHSMLQKSVSFDEIIDTLRTVEFGILSDNADKGTEN